VRNWDVAILQVTDGVGLWAVTSGVRLEAPFATVVAVAVSVVTGFHTYEAVVVGLRITVFILEEVDLSCQRWILSGEAVSYPTACLGRLVSPFVDEKDLGHGRVSSVFIGRPSEVLHDLFFV
jgi:hypothetical protein